MNLLLLSSVSLNIILSGYVAKIYFRERVSSRFNHVLSDVVKKMGDHLSKRYNDLSNERSPEFSSRAELFNRIVRQIFPEIILPRQINENWPRCHRLVDYLVKIVSPFDIYTRYRSHQLDSDTREWINSMSDRISNLQLDELVSQVFPNILRQILYGHTPISHYYLSCQYRHLHTLKHANVYLNADRTENCYVSVCYCGKVETNLDYCSTCSCEIKQKVDYEAFISFQEALSITSITHCPITLNELLPETEIAVLSCGHYGEKEPIINWIQSSYRCHYAQCSLKPFVGVDNDSDSILSDEEEDDYLSEESIGSVST